MCACQPRGYFSRTNLWLPPWLQLPCCPTLAALAACFPASARSQQQQQRAGGRSADEAPVSGGTSAFLAGTLVQVWWEAVAVCLEWAHAVEGQTVAAGPAAALSTASSTSRLAALSWQLHSTACRHVHMSLRGPSAAPPTTPASVWWGGLRTLLDSSLQFAIWCQQRKQEATGGR